MPEGWAWCRLGELFYHTTGKALKKSNNKGSLLKYITTSNLYWNKFDFTEVREMYFTDDELDKCTIKKGDLVLCNGGDVGRAAIWNFDEDICYQNHVSRLRPKIIGINNKLYLYLLMFYKEQGMLNGKGVGITSLSANDLLSGLFPLLPINEQDQIVIKIENIFSQIDYIDENKSDLQTAIKQTKSKILDLAIHGKLVPQDSNDEPAEELLKRIATSDNRPYEKVEDEAAYEIPKNWCLSKIKDVCSVIMGQSPEGTSVSNNTNGMEFHQGKIYFGEKYLEESSSFTNHITKIAPKDSVLLCVRAPVGIVNITQREICIGRGLCAVNPKYDINSDFWFYWLKSLQSDFEQKATGTTFRAISVDVIKNQIIPIPPVEEQKRIVNKIGDLYSLLDQIQINLV
ncbi:MAG: restriction endonuclease subunit S [Treponema sp.]|nr:restriction endonuclease subunit S [Treponema sp.]